MRNSQSRRVAARYLAAHFAYPKPRAGHVLLFHTTSKNRVLEQIVREGIRANRGTVWSTPFPDKFRSSNPMVAFEVPSDDPAVEQANRHGWTDVTLDRDIPKTSILAAYPVVRVEKGSVPHYNSDLVRLDHVLVAGVPWTEAGPNDPPW